MKAVFPGDFARASLKQLLGRRDFESNVVFPGDFARASLKHAVMAEISVKHRCIPGRFRPGLIEAAGAAAEIEVAAGVFPGDFARASLKHFQQDGQPSTANMYSRAISPGPH